MSLESISVQEQPSDDGDSFSVIQEIRNLVIEAKAKIEDVYDYTDVYPSISWKENENKKDYTAIINVTFKIQTKDKKQMKLF